MTNQNCDAVVVGGGPNGLAAAITLAQNGKSVRLYEAGSDIGGGTRTKEITLPGFKHDICSAIHPLGLASPLMRDLPLAEFGLKWIYPHAPLAHPLDGGRAVMIRPSIKETAAGLGKDAQTYFRLMRFMTRNSQKILREFLGPLRVPRFPLAMAGFGAFALFPAHALDRLLFKDVRARALFAGMAAHSILPLDRLATASFGLMLGMLTHDVGWPMAQGGSQAITQAMAAYLRQLGGEIVFNHPVETLASVTDARAVLVNVTPRQLLKMAGDELPPGYQGQLRKYRYGPGVFKMDIALDGPAPWEAPECLEAGSVHLGGTMEEIIAGEKKVWQGDHPEKPFVLVGQQSLFDPTRAPEGKHTIWAYCHVPNGSTVDMSDRILGQFERFAPGFSNRILAVHTYNTREMEMYNPNYVGGDINGGAQDLGQLFTRPVPRLDPYSTPVKGLFLCSSSTPPGGGVHGMCGYWGAQSALKYLNT